MTDPLIRTPDQVKPPPRSLVELDRINRSWSNAVPVGGPGSHWVGCESVHPACRAALHR